MRYLYYFADFGLINVLFSAFGDTLNPVSCPFDSQSIKTLSLPSIIKPTDGRLLLGFTVSIGLPEVLCWSLVLTGSSTSDFNFLLYSFFSEILLCQDKQKASVIAIMEVNTVQTTGVSL